MEHSVEHTPAVEGSQGTSDAFDFMISIPEEDTLSLRVIDKSELQVDESITWDIVELNRIRGKLFLGATVLSIISALLLAAEPVLSQTQFWSQRSVRDTIFAILFGSISLAVTTAFITYVVQYRLKHR